MGQIQERGREGVARVSERFTYAGNDAEAAAVNRCGQMLRHDHTAGSLWIQGSAITGAVTKQEDRFLAELELPDWPEVEADREKLLETAPGAVSCSRFNALGELISRTDAQSNSHRLVFTVAGQLKSTWLQLAGRPEQVVLSEARYSEFDRIESEVAGNGVATLHRYNPVDGRLQRCMARKDSHVLQDLTYQYDPVGNILRIEDAAQSTKYFRNQAIAPVSTYAYDTLYQLIKATGREAIDASPGPDLPGFQSPGIDPGGMANYTQRYTYDAAGNLQTLAHVGGRSYTRQMVTARYSNRSLPVVDGHIPDEAELLAGFDEKGNLCALQPGQSLMWDPRNQLQQVTPVVRDSGDDDYERYIYDGGGRRVRKAHRTQAASVTHRAEVRYLPGLEIRTNTATDEIFHVISISGACVLHWVKGKPEDVVNDQFRYSLIDHLGSNCIELDEQANLISQEGYYPFGGTAWWAGRSAVEVNYKTIRYCGKERDATGLCYYGFRYYAPWLARWINPDPVGVVDGLNLYVMVGNQPVNHVDVQGHSKKDMNDVNMNALARSTANRVFGSESALTEEGIERKKDNAWNEMQARMDKYGWSREQHAQMQWDLAKTFFAESKKNLYARLAFEKKTIEARATVLPDMTADEKMGLHLFWSTNVGAGYFNEIARSGASKLTLAKASNLAGLELGRGGGEQGCGLSESRQKTFKSAINKLGNYEAHPKQVVKMLGASLGASMNGTLYRGGRIAKEATLALGQLLTTSGFAAFSPDKSTAKNFSGDTYHGRGFAASTYPVLFELQEGGAKEIFGRMEIEGLFPPGKNFVVRSLKQESHYLRVGLVSDNTRRRGTLI